MWHDVIFKDAYFNEVIFSWQTKEIIHSIKYLAILQPKPIASLINISQMAVNANSFNWRPQDKFYSLVSFPVPQLTWFVPILVHLAF